VATFRLQPGVSWWRCHPVNHSALARRVSLKARYYGLRHRRGCVEARVPLTDVLHELLSKTDRKHYASIIFSALIGQVGRSPVRCGADRPAVAMLAMTSSVDSPPSTSQDCRRRYNGRHQPLMHLILAANISEKYTT
jgi:hypothetical protein